jgi:photosystem II stability/assembly factor-like uncharacterized protein
MRKLRNHAGHFHGLATAILVMTGGVAWGTSWKEINTGLPSAVVGVRAITIDPATPSTIYGCSSSGFIFKSADGGEGWTAIGGVAGARSVVIDPTDSSTIYAGTGHGIVKSTNGGESWIGVNTGLTDTSISMLAIDPITPSILFAVAFRSIFKSTNGGETWNAIGFPADIAFFSLVMDPMAPSTLYAVGNVGVFKSTDGGRSWNGISGVRDVRSLVVDPKNSSTIYATALTTLPHGGIFQIFKSTDGGQSWNIINTGLPDDAYILNLAIDPITPSTIYASYSGDSDQGIVKSTDGGESWQVINTGLPSGDVGSLAIDPTAPSTIYASYSGPTFRNQGGVYKSTNGGASWDAADAGLTTIDVRVLAIDPVNAATLYTAAGNTVFKSVDSGASWTRLFTFHIAFQAGPPGPVVSPFGVEDAIVRSLLIDFVDPHVLYAETARTDGCASSDKLVFTSTDGGASWSAGNGQPGACNGDVDLSGVLSLVLDPRDPNTLYVGDMASGGLLKSTDGAASWSSVWGRSNGLESSVWALAIDPTKPSTLYAGIELSFPGIGGVFKSTDGGMSWSSAGLGDAAAVTVLAIDRANSSTLYAVTESQSVWYDGPQGFRGMFKSTDSGASWLPINNGLAGLIDTGFSVTALLIDPQDPNILYAGTSGGGVFRSADSGANWSPFNDGLTNPDVRVLDLAPGSPNTLYAGTAGGVFAITFVP